MSPPSGGWTWGEPFAGAAACALRLVGGRDLLPPVAWMGGKRRLARAILDAMGVPAGPPARVLLADAGPWGWVWPLLLDPAPARAVASVLRSWAGEHPRELWQRLAAQPPAESPHERAAQWLWLQARSASSVPVFWDAERSAWLFDDVRGSGRRPICQVGQRTAKHGGGMCRTANLAARMEAVSAAFARVESIFHVGDAAGLAPPCGIGCWCCETWLYLDPPYVGATGYGANMARERVEALARKWAANGAVVAVSEAEPLDLPGWHHVDLTRPGGKPEWLTLSRPPAALPAKQSELWEVA